MGYSLWERAVRSERGCDKNGIYLKVIAFLFYDDW